MAALAFGSLFLVRKKKRRSSSSSSGSSSGSSSAGPWAFAAETYEERAMVMMEIQNMARWVSDRYGMMPLLSEYLTVIAFRESRFNPSLVASSKPNAATGLFQMRPETAFTAKNGLKEMVPYSDVLFNIRWSFVMAVDGVARAAFTVTARDADWLSARRWWNTWYLAKDFDESNPTSKGVRERLEKAITDCNKEFATNIDPEFIWQPIQANNYPGVGQLLYDFGLNPNDPYAAVA